MLCPRALLNQQIDDVYINTLKTNYFFLRQEICAVFLSCRQQVNRKFKPSVLGALYKR